MSLGYETKNWYTEHRSDVINFAYVSQSSKTRELVELLTWWNKAANNDLLRCFSADLQLQAFHWLSANLVYDVTIQPAGSEVNVSKRVCVRVYTLDYSLTHIPFCFFLFSHEIAF